MAEMRPVERHSSSPSVPSMRQQAGQTGAGQTGRRIEQARESNSQRGNGAAGEHCGTGDGRRQTGR